MIQKEILNRNYSSSPQKVIVNADKSPKVTFREVSRHSSKEKSVHMDVNMSIMAQKQQRIQDSMIIPNFQDRFKSIIATALKDSSRVDDSGESSEKLKRKSRNAPSIMSPPCNGFTEIYSKESEEISENQGRTSVKYSRNIHEKNKVSFINLTSKESKTKENSFKQVELSDPEVSSSLTNAAYSPISPSRTPPSSSSPVFQVHESPVKSALGGYTINLGLSVSRNMLSHEYHSKRVSASTENVPEHSELGIRGSNKNDSINSSHNKDSAKSMSMPPFSHLIEQSKSKAIDEIKGKNGYSLNSRSHSHHSSSSMLRDDEYSRKFKSKYHNSIDIIKDKKMKHRSNSLHISKSGKKDISYSKSSRSGSSKFESKRSSSKHSYSSSSKCKYFL